MFRAGIRRLQRSGAYPNLLRNHPGYFTVAFSLLVTHLFLAVDLSRPVTISRGLRILDVSLGHDLKILAGIHLAIAVAMFIGIWGDSVDKRLFWCARWAFGMSFVVFNILFVLIGAAVIEYGLSAMLPVCCVSLSISSLAAYREPKVNPASERSHV